MRVSSRSMIMRSKCAAFLALAGFLLLAGGTRAAGRERVGRITSFIGSVHLSRSGDGRTMPARVNSPVFVNDTIASDTESRCEIVCSDGIVIRVDEKSLFVVTRPPAAETAGSAGNGLKVAAGTIWVNARKLAGKSTFDLYTPTLTAGIRGTAYTIACDANAADVMVFDGVVAVQPVDSSARDSLYAIGAGERMAVVKDVDAFIEAERAALLDFMRAEQDAYEQFLREEQEAYDEFQATMEQQLEAFRNEFAAVGDVHVAKQSFSIDSATTREWIRWNRERDKNNE